MSLSRTLPAVAALALVAVYCAIFGRYRLDPGPGAPHETLSRCVAHLRAVVDGRPEPAPALAALPLAGPLWVTLLRHGERLVRVRVDEPDLEQALTAAGRSLASAPALKALPPLTRQEARIKLDLTLAQGPVLSSIPILFANSVVPGLDGLGLEVAGRSAYLLPDDLLRRELLAADQPFFFMEEFRSGLDLKATVSLLADELGLDRERWRSSSKRYFRFRVQSVVETAPASGRAAPALRGRVPAERINRATVRQAVVRAADYVLRQILPDGSFRYIYYPFDDHYSPPGDYSLPRHAGTTWFLSLAYRALGDARFKEGARRAIDYLGAQAVPRECQGTPRPCVGSRDDADLGSAALSVVAIVEYQQATGDRRFEPLARGLGRFILWMQKPNGDFCHGYRPSRNERNCRDMLLYYSGEAALALAKLHALTGETAYLDPLERALDFLTDENYDFFMGQFFIGEDHWTCIAAEAAPPRLHKPEYARFCYEFAALNRRAQVGPAEGVLADLHGAFAITPFFIPHNCPAGSRTEANVATYLLSQKRGEPQAEVLDTVRRAVRFLVDQQLRPEGTYLLPNAAAADGGMPQTAVRAAIRIDYVQHAAAAMARALPLIPEQDWEPAR